MVLEQIYGFSVRKLKNSGVPEPELDARAIIAHRMGLDRNEVFLHKNDSLRISALFRILADIQKRSRFMPVAFILGYKDFFMDRFIVSRRTLIPRADTEHLLYAVQESGRTFKKVLDIGTGTGALAVSASRLFPEAEITAVDADIFPVKRNVQALGIKNVRLVRMDFLKEKEFPGKFDLILSNPPYLSDEDMENLGKDARLYEPFRAFYGGRDGLDFYRRIAIYAKNCLDEKGMIVLETDHKWKEAAKVVEISGFSLKEVRKDYNGMERVLIF